MKCLLGVGRGIAVAGEAKRCQTCCGGIYAQFFVKLSDRALSGVSPGSILPLEIPNPAIGLPSDVVPVILGHHDQ